MKVRDKVIGISTLVLALGVVFTVFFHYKPVAKVMEGRLVIPPLRVSALDKYLTHPPKVENAPWTKSTPPHESIPNSLKQFTSGKTELERAFAIGFLAYTAEQMTRVPETKEAANDN